MNFRGYHQKRMTSASEAWFWYFQDSYLGKPRILKLGGLLPSPARKKKAQKDAIFSILCFCHLPVLLMRHSEPNRWQ